MGRIVSTEHPAPTPSRRAFVLWIIAVVVVVAAACVVGTLLAGVNGLVAAAAIATALGTLALAWQTFALARATRKAVDESGSELEELKTQRALLEKQADGIAAQAEASIRLAETSAMGSLAAAQTRIDAVSPLIYLRGDLTSVIVVEVPGGARRSLTDVDQWFEPQLKDVRFEVILHFRMKNVGNAPANVSFGDTSTFLEGVVRDKLTYVILEPGEVWDDDYIVKIYGPEAINQTEVRMPFTYEGVLYAEMFDRIQWNAMVTPLLLNDGVAKLAPRVVNGNGAHVFRSYTRMDDPERIKKQADFIMYGEGA
jgi:hypothetical protein